MSEYLYHISSSASTQEVMDDIKSDFGGYALSDPINQGMSDEDLIETMHEFTQSREFRQDYSARDRELAIRAFAACANGNLWKYNFHVESEDVLFTASVPGVVKPANLVDGLVLSGALGWSRDEYGDLIDYVKEKKIALLDAHRLAGAASLTIRRDVLESGEYGFEEDGIATTQYVGADLHGDFRMRRIVRAGDAVTAPHGERVDISPLLEHHTAAAYHSTEMNIVAAMLAHLFHDKSTEEKQALKHAILESVSQDKHWLQPFGDLGDEAGHVERYAKSFNGHDIRTGEVLDELIVTPDRRHIFLEIVSEEAGIDFVTIGLNADNEREHLDKVTIPNGEIADFIVALGNAGQGRVRIESLRRLIALFA